MYAPQFLRMRFAAPLAVVCVFVLLAGIFIGLDREVLPSAAADAELKRVLEALKATLLIGAFLGAVLTGLYAYRKQQIDEASELRADAQELGARFSRAAEQLGHSSAAVRLSGVFSLAALADEWESQRQLCINVLTTYLQIPYDRTANLGEREVRRNMIRIIRDHLNGFSSVSWSGCNFRFEGVQFEGGDLTGARFTGGNVTFHAAKFVAGTFYFDRIEIAGARVWFTKAEFSGGSVRFDKASMTSGSLTFEGSQVNGGSVTFDGFVHRGGQLDPGPFGTQIGP